MIKLLLFVWVSWLGWFSGSWSKLMSIFMFKFLMDMGLGLCWFCSIMYWVFNFVPFFKKVGYISKFCMVSLGWMLWLFWKFSMKNSCQQSWCIKNGSWVAEYWCVDQNCKVFYSKGYFRLFSYLVICMYTAWSIFMDSCEPWYSWWDQLYMFFDNEGYFCHYNFLGLGSTIWESWWCFPYWWLKSDLWLWRYYPYFHLLGAMSGKGLFGHFSFIWFYSLLKGCSILSGWYKFGVLYLIMVVLSYQVSPSLDKCNKSDNSIGGELIKILFSKLYVYVGFFSHLFSLISFEFIFWSFAINSFMVWYFCWVVWMRVMQIHHRLSIILFNSTYWKISVFFISQIHSTVKIIWIIMSKHNTLGVFPNMSVCPFWHFGFFYPLVFGYLCFFDWILCIYSLLWVLIQNHYGSLVSVMMIATMVCLTLLQFFGKTMVDISIKFFSSGHKLHLFKLVIIQLKVPGSILLIEDMVDGLFPLGNGSLFSLSVSYIWFISCPWSWIWKWIGWLLFSTMYLILFLFCNYSDM